MHSISKLQSNRLSQVTPGQILLWLLILLVLLFGVWMAFDFITHPFAAGANASVIRPYLFRWVSFVDGLISLTVAFFIIRRRPGNIIGPLLVLYSVGVLTWSGRTEWADLRQAGLITVIGSLYFFCIALPVIILTLYYFPTGTTYPRWLQRWMAPLAILIAACGALAIIGSRPEDISGMPNIIYRPGFEFGNPLFIFALTFSMVGALASLVARYRKGNTLERLQLRWLIWLLAMLIIASRLGDPLALVMPLWMNQIYRVMVFVFWHLFLCVAIGIALLRYRLWDIDIIIRRTLVYTALTAILGVVYFGSVISIQRMSIAVTGQSSPVAIVISTLLIAALASPARIRVQTLIDRRFYRQRYDSEKALAAFRGKLRSEVDLEQVSEHLLDAVQNTIQPENAVLWIRKQLPGEGPAVK